MAIKIIIFLLLIIVIFATFSILTRKRHDPISRKPKFEPLTPPEEDESRWETCKSCGQRRIIMKEEMCAFCWSSSQTHGLR
jgi:hypothetical protein